MVRTILVPESENIVFSLPKEYVGKQIELIILPADDILVEHDLSPQKKKVQFSAVSLDTRDWKFDREEANAR